MYKVFFSLLLLTPLSLIAQEQPIAHNTISAIGTLYPKYKTILGSTVSGRVETVCVDVGDPVDGGQAVVTLDPTFFEISVTQAQAAVDAAKIERLDAKRNLDRMQKLWEKPSGEAPSIPKKRYEDAQVRYSQSQIGLQQAKAELKRASENLKETVIRSPYRGIVTKRLVHPGTSVTATPATDLIEIAFVDILYMEFSIPQVLRSKLHEHDGISINIEGESINKITAAIDRIFPDVDEKTRSVRCRAIIDNHDRRLHAGSLVKVTLEISKPLTKGT